MNLSGRRSEKHKYAAQTVYLTAGLIFLIDIGIVSLLNKWRLHFSGSAYSDGVIVLQLTLVGGDYTPGNEHI